MSVQIDVDLKELYNLLCKRCKKKMEKYIKNKIAEQLTTNLLKDKEGEKDGR